MRSWTTFVLAAICAVAVVFSIGLAFNPANGGLGSLLGASTTAHSDNANGDLSQSNASSNAQSLPDPVESADGTVVVSAEHVPGVVIVQLGSGASSEDLNASFANLPCIADSGPAVSQGDIDAGFAALQLAEGYNVADAMATLDSVDGVLAAQPNYLYHAIDETSGIDADHAQEGAALVAGGINYNLLNGTALLDALNDVNDPDGKKDAANNHSWHLQSINAYDAWSTVRGESLQGDNRVTVAVLDTGYDIDHADLTAGAESGIGGNVIAAYDATSNASENYNAGVGDINGHGTHVAGIIGAIANNETGVAGVSYNANVLPIQVFHPYEDDDGVMQNGASSLSVYYAYRYMVEHADEYNIRVANISLGAKATSTDSEDRLFINAAEMAYNAGILTVCAAGNGASSGPYSNFPSDYLTHGIGVIALDSDLTRASYSNYNTSASQRTKDISAPGTSIYSTTYNGAYGLKSGTSMAAPVVSGVAALVFSANPSLTPSQAISVLHDTARDLTPENSSANTSVGFDRYTGYGEVDAKAAVEGAGAYLLGDSSMLVGGTVDLVPTVDAPTGAWAWQSDNTAVATVDGGVVSGLSGGTAVITATSGAASISKTVTVYDISFAAVADGVASEDLEVVDEIELEAGESVQLQFNENPDTGIWAVGSKDSTIATVKVPSDGNILVTGVSAGETYVTATLRENPNLVVRCKVVVYDATVKRSLESSRAAVYWTFLDYFVGRAGSPSSSYYTGSLVKPVPYLVVYQMGNGSAKTAVALTQGTDFEMSYADNENVGQATATVVGMGSYEGEVSAGFSIVQTPLNRTSISGLGELTYTGALQEPVPALTLSIDGDYQLKEGLDFTVDSYENNVDASSNTSAGYASMSVAGKGNFTGNYTLRFTIKPASLSGASVTASGWTYDGRVHDPGVKVALGGKALEQGGDWTYELTKDGSAVSASSVLDAGTYTVTVTGQGNYEGSASTTFVVSPASVTSVSLSSTSYTYDGTAKAPTPTVKAGSLTVPSSGYSMTFASNVNAGTATATVTGKGNYTGTASASFKIAPASIAAATVTVSPTAQTYTGKALTPNSVTVKLGGKTLAAGTDYTLSYKNNTAIGTATVIVTGKGNYTGTASATFVISAQRLPLYRLYHPGSGEHHYTLSAYERDVCVRSWGWTYEGIAWYCPSTSSTPVYRLYNRSSGLHHYTTSAYERDVCVRSWGWTYEGIAWYSDDARAVPLYRLYHPVTGHHHYTMSAHERDVCVSQWGWRYEGIAWYGLK